mmetsp:Transcript_47746/g.137968  ORF Transcript_47746/g.137968 Transcript_47746/m.137968 type:complete len:541 (+) Transcript_47746:72-1694(+)
MYPDVLKRRCYSARRRVEREFVGRAHGEASWRRTWHDSQEGFWIPGTGRLAPVLAQHGVQSSAPRQRRGSCLRAAPLLRRSCQKPPPAFRRMWLGQLPLGEAVDLSGLFCGRHLLGDVVAIGVLAVRLLRALRTLRAGRLRRAAPRPLGVHAAALDEGEGAEGREVAGERLVGEERARRRVLDLRARAAHDDREVAVQRRLAGAGRHHVLMEKVYEAAKGHLGLVGQRLAVPVLDDLVGPQPAKLPRPQRHNLSDGHGLESPLLCQRSRPLCPPALWLPEVQAAGLIALWPPRRCGTNYAALAVEEEEATHREKALQGTTGLHCSQALPVVHRVSIALHPFPVGHRVGPGELLGLRRHAHGLPPGEVIVHGVQGRDLARDASGARSQPITLQDAGLHLPIEACPDVLCELRDLEVLRLERCPHHFEGSELLWENVPIHDHEDGDSRGQLRCLGPNDALQRARGRHLLASEHQALALPVHPRGLLDGLDQVRTCPIACDAAAMTLGDVNHLAAVAALHPHNHGFACGREGGWDILREDATH